MGNSRASREDRSSSEPYEAQAHPQQTTNSPHRNRTRARKPTHPAGTPASRAITKKPVEVEKGGDRQRRRTRRGGEQPVGTVDARPPRGAGARSACAGSLTTHLPPRRARETGEAHESGGTDRVRGGRGRADAPTGCTFFLRRPLTPVDLGHPTATPFFATPMASRDGDQPEGGTESLKENGGAFDLGEYISRAASHTSHARAPTNIPYCSMVAKF